MTDLEVYFDNTQKPWGKLFYRVVWDQLSFAKTLKLLDFGSGFGITSNYMAAFNEVTAVEPNTQMCEMRFQEHPYTQIIGGIEVLSEFPEYSFDLIICHNVLEYVERKEECISAFSRLLKSGGKLSLIKHNHFGRVIHKVIFENNIEQAINLLNGESTIAQNFGDIKYYDSLEINQWMSLYGFRLLNILGIRAFFALHPDNSIRQNENWINSMFELESMVSEIKKFRDIAFFNHVILEKS